jgi:hypothetical protein
MLIDECLIEAFDWRPWQEFRDRDMYTLEVNDVLAVNLELIKKLMKKYHEPAKKSFKLNDCWRLFTKDTPTGLTDKDFYYCYGMSKMTNVRESITHSQYYTLQLVEFLEVICRAADARYSESYGIPLQEKIELILDDLFKLIGASRV